MDEMDIVVPITPYFELAQQSIDEYLQTNDITASSGMTDDQEDDIRSRLQELTRECPYLNRTVLASSELLFVADSGDDYPDEDTILVAGGGCIRGVFRGFSVSEYQCSPEYSEIGLVAVLCSTVEVNSQEAEERFVMVPLDGESVVTAFLPEYLN